jgi:glycosyltransferase involved in cell wall biosynthesis
MTWLIYPGKGRTEAALLDHAHVFVASDVYARKLRKRVPGLEPSVLPQAFDAARMTPGTSAPVRPPVFVGNRHFRDRPMAGHLEATGLPAQIWGRGWEATPVGHLHQADVLPNEELGAVYAASQAVLCDHTPVMARNGFLSNRVLDALACGAPVITDPVAGIDARFLPYIFLVATAEDFADALAAIRAETPETRAERRRFARAIRETDSFDARATTIMNTARSLGLI